MAALSEWLLPRGTTVELNRDEYVQPGAATSGRRPTRSCNGIVDAATGTPAHDRRGDPGGGTARRHRPDDLAGRAAQMTDHAIVEPDRSSRGSGDG